MIIHLLEALRWASDQPCKPSNCGTVCLCGPCSARRTLAVLDPSYKPRHRKNFYFPVRLDRITPTKPVPARLRHKRSDHDGDGPCLACEPERQKKVRKRF